MFICGIRAAWAQLGWVEINEVRNVNPALKFTELPLTRVLCFWQRIIVLFYPAQTRQHNCSFLKTVIQRAFCDNPPHSLFRCHWSICWLVVFPMPTVLLQLAQHQRRRQRAVVGALCCSTTISKLFEKQPADICTIIFLKLKFSTLTYWDISHLFSFLVWL